MSSESGIAGGDEEILQVVNDRDEPVCGMRRAEVHANRRLHRAVHVLVFNKPGDLYLQRRSRMKETYPGYWDSSSSGHVREDETYEAAAVRELEEELGIGGMVSYVGKINACEATEGEFVCVYSLTHEGEIFPNEEEIDEGRFLPMEQIRRELRNGARPFTSSFSRVFQLYAAHQPTEFDGD